MEIRLSAALLVCVSSHSMDSTRGNFCFTASKISTVAVGVYANTAVATVLCDVVVKH